MLNQVLRELQTSGGTLRLGELAARLNIETSALEGMLAFWANKGKFSLVTIEGDRASCAAPCTGSCPGAAACPFVAQMPTMWEMKG